MQSTGSMSRMDKMRTKHASELDKLQAKRDELKRKGNVKSWLEVFVLVNEDRAMFTRPVASHLANGEASKSINPYVHTGFIVPPNVVTQKQQQQQQRAHSPRLQPVTSPVLPAYEQLPTPQNPKLILANERKLFDNALDDQLALEQTKLLRLQESPDATNRQVQQQQALVEQLLQQKEMVAQQHAQNEANRAKVRKHKPSKEAAAQPASTPRTLEDRLKRFFHKHEPEALHDGRVEAVLLWTEERGEDKLNAMLREQYGRDLNGQLNVESTFVDQVQADRIARRLHGFYQAKQVSSGPAQWSECQKIGEWACKAGEAALNAKLRAKYHDDLDSYAQSIMLQVEHKLRAFYEQKNPQVMREKGIGPLLTWTVSNGIPALNALLLEKYGEDLQGRKRDHEEKSEYGRIAARSVLYRDLQRAPSRMHMNAKEEEEPLDDVLDQRKQMLIRQLASFLEVNDPKRLTQGGLVPLVQWALPRTDKQVDELLLETYGTDLEDAGLRDFHFEASEVAQWQMPPQQQQQQPPEQPPRPAQQQQRDSMAYLAGKAANLAMEDEYTRAEIRSQRVNTMDDPLLAMPQMFETDEPDF